MDIPCAEDRDRKQRLRQQQTISCDDDNIWTGDSHALDGGGRDFLGLVYIDAPRTRIALDGTRIGPQTAAGRTIGLGQNERELVAGFNQARQRRRCEFWRAGED